MKEGGGLQTTRCLLEGELSACCFSILKDMFLLPFARPKICQTIEPNTIGAHLLTLGKISKKTLVNA